MSHDLQLSSPKLDSDLEFIEWDIIPIDNKIYILSAAIKFDESLEALVKIVDANNYIVYTCEYQYREFLPKRKNSTSQQPPKAPEFRNVKLSWIQSRSSETKRIYQLFKVLTKKEFDVYTKLYVMGVFAHIEYIDLEVHCINRYSDKKEYAYYVQKVPIILKTTTPEFARAIKFSHHMNINKAIYDNRAYFNSDDMYIGYDDDRNVFFSLNTTNIVNFDDDLPDILDSIMEHLPYFPQNVEDYEFYKLSAFIKDIEPKMKAQKHLKQWRDDVNTRKMSTYWDQQATNTNFERRRADDILKAKQIFSLSRSELSLNLLSFYGV